MKDRNDPHFIFDNPVTHKERKPSNERQSGRSINLSGELRIFSYSCECFVNAVGEFASQSVTLVIVVGNCFGQVRLCFRIDYE